MRRQQRTARAKSEQHEQYGQHESARLSCCPDFRSLACFAVAVSPHPDLPTPRRPRESGGLVLLSARHSPVPSLLVHDLGAMPYGDALALQREVARRRISGEIAEDVLLLVEHPHVVTLGRAAKQASMVATPELLAARGVELFEVERGGDVTYHGPGQLVGYPIIDLKRHKQDLHWYLRQVEEALINALAAWGLSGHREAGYTGVWVGDTGPSATSRPRKIASIGVHARDWVTWHGFALNVATDLSFFDLMVPCGIAEVEMTSVARELGRTCPTMEEARRVVSGAVAATFHLDPVAGDPRTLEPRGAP
jgi:lipoyl(octanoyl) transferase